IRHRARRAAASRRPRARVRAGRRRLVGDRAADARRPHRQGATGHSGTVAGRMDARPAAGAGRTLMRWWLAALGFVIARWWGALAGFVIGSWLDERRRRRGPRVPPPSAMPPVEVLEDLLTLAVAVARADGRLGAEEV